MIKFIAADLDGTLLNSRKELPEELEEIARRLRDRGIVFAPASGRQYFNLFRQFSPFGGEFMYIAENGAMVVRGGKPVILDCMDTGEAKRMVEAVRGIPTAYAIVCCDDAAFGEDESSEEFARNARMYYERYRVVDDLCACCEGKNICKIAVFDEEDAEKNVYMQLKSLSAGNVILSGDKWVDVMKDGVTKGSAVRRIQERYGWTPEECMAFGDYLNDCEMLEACAYSYAMENAHPALWAHANYTSPSNDNNGVVRVIREVLQL